MPLPLFTPTEAGSSAEATASSGGVAGCPLHVTVAELNVISRRQQRITAIGRDQLEGVE